MASANSAFVMPASSIACSSRLQLSEIGLLRSWRICDGLSGMDMIRDTANDTLHRESCQHEYSLCRERVPLKRLTCLREPVAAATVCAVPTVAENLVRLRKAAGFEEQIRFARAIK